MVSLPPLNSLRAFEASARLGSFTQAAEELNVTQAAVSQQVKLLEHHLKTALFVREAKGVRLTEAGRSYQPVLTQSFHTLRIGTEELFGERGKTLLSVRVSNSFAEHFLAARLPRFLADYPRFRVRIYSSPWSTCANDEQADIEICNGYGDWVNRQVERLTQEHWLVICSQQTLSKRGPVTDATEFLNWPRASVMGYREGWAQWFHKQGVQHLPNPSHLEFDTTTLAIRAVMSGDLVLMARSFLVADALAEGTLVQPHSGILPTQGGHYMVWRNGDQRPKVTAFCDWLRRELALHSAQAQRRGG
ncbi:LysR substrate-binding domain-containing protein [Salinispirillum sp. LH 10-3-1]|uniref:LysR substrate-binding domain-containing protein n=1 Tax=Salinispirillum sp. LH 10-3-1 TaxID=2952525 RepID=A0AB38YJA8_9GAMM